eukprot:s1742_g4.t1
MNSAKQEFRQKMHHLNRMMGEQGLPAELRKRLRTFFLQNRHQSNFVTHQQLLQDMSAQLQAEVCTVVNLPWLRKVPFFNNFLLHIEVCWYPCFDRDVSDRSYPAMVCLSFGSPINGQLFTGVVNITSTSVVLSYGELVATHTPVILCRSNLSCGHISVYDFLVQREDDLIFLVDTPSSWLSSAPSHAQALLPELLELCAGSGGMGLGAVYAGGTIKVSVDYNDLAVQHLLANQHGQVLHLDLTDPQTPKKVHQACNGPIGTVTMGFPCQPFSVQGWQQGTSDSRFLVFVSGLKIIVQIQPQSAILECVMPARSEPEIQQLLQQLAALMHWDVLQVNLHLHDRWPCRRSRWWILLLPSAWNCLGLPSWQPSSQYATVGHIFQHWGLWPSDEEAALQLLAYELEAYLDPQHGQDKRLLEMTDVAATILHSYANALQGCPCRLFTVGLFSGYSRVGTPKYFTDLTGPGRHKPGLQCNARQALQQDPLPAPEEWIHQYCLDLMRQSQCHFDNDHVGAMHHFRLIDEAGQELIIVSPLTCTASQLLSAHRIVLGWNQSVGLSQNDHSVPLGLPLGSDPYTLHIHSGNPDRPPPPGQFAVSLTHQGTHHLIILIGGQFLFEALAQIEAFSVRFLVDWDGVVYGADYRVWRPLRLVTLDPAHWPPTMPASIQARGHASLRIGLHDQHVWQALTCMAASISHLQLLLVHPLTAAHLLGEIHTPSPGLLDFTAHGSSHPHSIVLCIFPSQGHWALLHGSPIGSSITWTYSDGFPGHLTIAAASLARSLTSLLGFSSMDFRVSHWILQTAPHTCGTIALLHTCHHLGLCGDLTDEMILGLHEHLLGTSRSPFSLLGFGPQTVETQLAALLVSKGVPWTSVSERATAALHKLGHPAVLNALQQANPWGALKSLASKPGKHFQFVTKDELQDYVTQKASDKHGAQISSRKKQQKKPFNKQVDPQLDPASLSLLPGHFVDPDHDAVEQITLDQVTADARGIAICDLPQALPYIKEALRISSDALALLVLQEVPTELREHADLCSLRYPATYLPTKDPLLIQGSLLQLGDIPIQRKPVEEPMGDMDVSNTAVLKLQVYRDELGQPWDHFIDSPIKHVIALVPKLRMCHNPKCDFRCGSFHAAIEDNFDQVIHEIWARRFQSLEGRVQPAAQALVFQAFLRVASSALEELLPFVAEGIYLEPRCEATKSTDTTYAVVWIPGATRESAMHKLKTIQHGLGLVRLKQRYGIRVKAIHEQLVHQELRPNDSYVKTTVTKVWRLHPLPHGLSRAQLSKLLAEWCWPAKPLQPSRGTSEGGAWEVGSSADPPQPVLPAFGKDVLINLLKDKAQPEKQKSIIAPKRAQDHLRNQQTAPAASSDPWLTPQHDPWGKFVSSGTAAAQPKHYDVLAKKLKEDLSVTFREQLHADGSSSTTSTGLEQRMQKMEVGLTELQAHNQQIGTWMKDAGTKIAAQDEQLQQVHQGLQQQQADLVAVRSEVHSSATTLHQAMQTSFSTMKQEIVTDMATTLDHQMSRFETLLTAKKPRQE